MSIKIIVAEDHTLFRECLVKTLKNYGIDVIGEVENGKELLDLLCYEQPDVILLDLEMPIINGLEAFNKIKNLHPTIKVVFISMYYDQQIIDHVMSIGAHGFHKKNDKLEAVVKTIEEVYQNNIVIATCEEKTILKTIKFSKREHEIVSLVCNGKSNKEIANELSISDKTVEAHKKSLFKKTNTQSAVGLVSFVLKQGLNLIR